MSGADQKAFAKKIRERLERAIPEPYCELDFQNAWQLLIATILSAQSNDKTINRVTPKVFERYPTPAALAAADPEELEDVVRATGFFRNKAKAIRATSQALVDHHGGEVPRTLEEMVKLPGVARKTANVVLGTAYRIPSGIIVDTHAARVGQRLGLTEQKDPGKVEANYAELFPKTSWIDTGHRLVLHGRYVCLAKKPACSTCPLFELCPSADGEPEGKWTERAEKERAVVEARGA